jgi:HEAT repeat-containing protein 5
LAAIKDHALLSLSPEFKSQLPYEGGAFYTNDTIELARPHYRITWAPILHAAAVWLTHGGGFANVAAEKTELATATDSANIGLGPANATAQGVPPEEINRSRFHLLLGVGMEALCSPRAGELTPEQLGSCLAALAALLEAEEARRLLMAEAGIGVELCNVLHRQLLSQVSRQGLHRYRPGNFERKKLYPPFSSSFSSPLVRGLVKEECLPIL